MGMSIDETEAIEILKDIRLNANYMQNKESRTGMACELAVDTMRKYQKIDQIISDGYLQGKSSGEMLLGIKGVMNRNDD